MSSRSVYIHRNFRKLHYSSCKNYGTLNFHIRYKYYSYFRNVQIIFQKSIKYASLLGYKLQDVNNGYTFYSKLSLYQSLL